MSKFHYGGYPEDLKERLKILLDAVRAYGGELWVGDCFGPQRDAASIKVNIARDGNYILLDPNSEKFKIGFYKKQDVEASNGIVFHTGITDMEEFLILVDQLLRSLFK